MADIGINIDLQDGIFRELNQLKEQFEAFRAQVGGMETKFDDAFKKVEVGAKNAGSALRIVAYESMDRLWSTLGAPFRAGADGVYSYNASLLELSAITGVTGPGLDRLGASARTMSTEFGGNASAHLQTYQVLLSKLTPELAKQPEALQSIAESSAMLARTMKGDTTGAVNAITSAMNQFSVDLSNPITAAGAARDMMNQMAASAQIGSVEVPGLAQALDQSGSAARAANVSFIETNAALQVLGKYGKEGAEGGVALRNVLGILNRQEFLPKEVLSKLQKAGVDITALADKSVPLATRLEHLKKISGTNILSAMFGTENQVAAQALIENTALIKDFTAQIEAAGPAGEQMSATIGESYEQVKERIVAGFDNIKLAVFGLTGATMPYLDVILSAMGGMLGIMPDLLSVYELFKMLSIATKIQSIATGAWALVTKGATAVQLMFNAAFLASPLGWIVLAIGAVTGAVIYAWNHFEGFRKVVLGVWESIKVFGEMLYDLTIGHIINLVKGIGNLGKALFQVFTGDFSGAWESAKEGAMQLSGVATVKSVVETASKVPAAYKKGSQEGSDSFAKSIGKDQLKPQKLGGESGTPLVQPMNIINPGQQVFNLVMPGYKKEETTNSDNNKVDPAQTIVQIPGATGSGSKNSTTSTSGSGIGKSVQIRIENLVGKIEIVTNKLSESTGKVKDMVSEALIAAVRDAEIAV